MTSHIDTSNINVNFPVQGTDNSSQGFRDNFNNISAQLNIAASEITTLQNNPVGVTTATTTTAGLVQIGSNIAINTNGIISINYVLPTYSTATLSTVVGLTTGSIVLVSDAPGGIQPCFYDGSHWYAVGRTQIL